MDHAVSLWTVSLEWSATDPVCITRHTQTVRAHWGQYRFVLPAGRDLALSWLWAVRTARYNYTYLLICPEKCADRPYKQWLKWGVARRRRAERLPQCVAPPRQASWLCKIVWKIRRNAPFKWTEFLPRCMECNAVLRWDFCPSVRLSVCLSVCLSNACIVTKRKKAMFRFFLYHMKEHLS